MSHQEAPNCHNMSARLGSKGGKAGGVRDFSFKEDLHCTALHCTAVTLTAASCSGQQMAKNTKNDGKRLPLAKIFRDGPF